MRKESLKLKKKEKRRSMEEEIEEGAFHKQRQEQFKRQQISYRRQTSLRGCTRYHPHYKPSKTGADLIPHAWKTACPA